MSETQCLVQLALESVTDPGHSGDMTGIANPRSWVLGSDEPWARYRALLDLENLSSDSGPVVAARDDLLSRPMVGDLLKRAAEWPGYPLKRHNDAAHPLYAIATLADFGLRREDHGIDTLGADIMSHFDGEGFETLVWLPKFLTKEDDAESWAWMLCDAPTLLYSLLAFGFGSHPDVVTAVAALVSRASDDAWRCGAAESIPKFSGPGRRDDTCPIATTYALKVLSLVPEQFDSAAVASGIEALLTHWDNQKEYKLKMFGIGTDFRKLKYPYVWYDILHVTDVLSRFAKARRDPRLIEMVAEIASQADEDGRYCAGSMYRAWKDWSFADKKQPSPWLTMLVLRIQERMANPDVSAT